MDTIKVTPLFDRRLEKAAFAALCSGMLFWKKCVAVGSLSIMIALAIFWVEVTAKSAVFGIFLGAAAMMIYMVLYGRFTQSHLHSLQVAAREKAAPFELRFSETGFEMDMSNAFSRYDWSAVDEVLTLRSGTGLRVGAWVFCVEDAALPDGESGDEFRNRLDKWMTG